jgi:tape measure domain-containing protein
VSVVANVAINVDSRNAVGKLRQVQSQSQATERAVGNLGAAVSKLAAALGVIQAARFVFVKTAELESQARSLQVLTGSAEKANQIIKDLQQLGAVTPFTSSELIDSAKRLQAFGVETDKVVETTRRLADVSGATGAELQGLVTAFGQVQAKGRLQGEELLQFQERGVALQQELRKQYNLSGEEFQDALQKGKISAEAVEFAIQSLTDAGGKYANGAIAQSDTLNGRFSTLQDGIEGLARTIGTALTPAIKAVLNEAIFAINTINQLLNTGARARSFGLDQRGRQQILRQAQDEARSIVEGRRIADPFERNRVFQELVGQRERDLIESYGIRTGQVKPQVTAPQGPRALPALGVGTTGGGKKGKSDAEKAAEKLAREAERAAEAAAKEQERVAEIIRSRLAEAEIIKLQSGLRDRISQAELDGDEQLAIRLQGAQKQLDIQYQYAQELAKEKDLEAQRAIIYEGQVALIASQRDTQRQLNELQRQQDQERFDALQKHVEKQYQLNAAVQGQLQLADGIANTLGQGIGSAFDALLTGSQAWSDSLREIASGVLLDIAKQLLQIFVIEQAINALRNIFTPFSAATPLGAGGGQIGRFGTLGPNFGIPQRAKGGPVTGGMPYMVGERGPELFVPGRSGTIVPNNQLGGGENVSVVVNVDAKGTSVQGNDQQGNQLGRAISAAVQAELIKQKRPGGLLA